MSIDTKRTSRIYEKLLRVAPALKQTRESAKSRVPGFMDLNLDVLERSENYCRVALSHYWKHPSGDMIADPDMEVAVFFDKSLAEALTYQDAYMFQVAYPIPGEPPDFVIHTQLNIFLEQWLDNLAEQGHVLSVNGSNTKGE